ncbi:RNA polymerase sigma factor [Sulfuriroseicoccus oceanibius]|uniref:RNA polymerase sigma factor n=1 Tax=Sulfuriroseicoccus oceanibius TaxID=2707525 RepID=A0A6B3L7R6_9BACT|nr:RNA polymerase sigma factor [Sulfuriroseicoccus oceanibius]QQL43779.1 RNA polymerase sigma factor [Sulfuriroseicoccus oceanibius]
MTPLTESEILEMRSLVESSLRDHEAALVHYTAGLLAGDYERARDVVQDAFLKLCRQQPSKVRENTKAWLYTVARNRAFDVIRKESRMVPSEGVPDSCDDKVVDPASFSERCDQSSELLTMVRELPHNQREVILLRFQQGMSYQEISEVTGLKTGNVGFLLHTGLKVLREKVARRGQTSGSELSVFSGGM